MLVQLEQIEADFPFFPRLHAILATRPNMNPPVITTGVGPNGRKIIYLQPPEHSPINHDTEGSPFAEFSGVFDVDPWYQYQNLLEAITRSEERRVGKEPIASTQSPTCTPSELPSFAYGS